MTIPKIDIVGVPEELHLGLNRIWLTRQNTLIDVIFSEREVIKIETISCVVDQ